MSKSSETPGQPKSGEDEAASWNIYVPGPDKDTNYSYIRAGAPYPATAIDKPDTGAGIALITTGAIKQTSHTSSVTSFGGEKYSAVFNNPRKMLYSATYQYEERSDYTRQVMVSNGGKFSLTGGDQEGITMGNKMDYNIGHFSQIALGLRFDNFAGVNIKAAPVELGISAERFELKAGGLSNFQNNAALRASSSVIIGVNPIADGSFLKLASQYTNALSALNTCFAAYASLGAMSFGVAGICAWGDRSEETVKSELKTLRDFFIPITTLFALTEVLALVLAAIAMIKTKGDPIEDGTNPYACSITVAPLGIKLQVGPNNYMQITPTGITISGLNILNAAAIQVQQVLQPPPAPIMVLPPEPSGWTKFKEFLRGERGI